MPQKITIKDIQAKKKNGEKIAMLTAYDYPIAGLLDEAGIDIVLVGDSLANVVLGLESTREVGLQAMLHHTKAVRRAVKNALLVGDMPYEAYQKVTSKAVINATRFMKEAGCDAVKIEWFDQCLGVVRQMVRAGVPVMGHVGLTPQTADQLGGLKVQGKEAATAKRIIANALALEKEGCFSIVLECIPAQVAQKITEKLSIPTIGIGAGVHCDGQVLVTYDLLGLFDRYKPKFVKQYTNLRVPIAKSVQRYIKEVREGKFPDDAHSYGMSPEEKKKL